MCLSEIIKSRFFFPVKEDVFDMIIGFFFFCRSCGLDEMLTVPVGRLRTEYALLQAVAWLTMLKISKMIKCYGHVLNKVVIF